MKKILFAACALALTVSFTAIGGSTNAEEKKDEKKVELEAYKRVPGVVGKISIIGSDTLLNLDQLWKEKFAEFYKQAVTIDVEGKGSSTAPPALTEGRADLGPMSRAMKDAEIKKFKDAFGYEPTRFSVAIDALAVYVHKDNTVDKLSMPQVDAIFSTNRKGGYAEDINKWGQVIKGKDEWANLGITLYGRNSASGTYAYFKEHALYKGDYKDSVKQQAGSATIVQLISEDRSGVGYSGLGYKTAGVRTVPLSKDATSEAYDATAENCYNGKYPLSRFLYIYVNKAPGKALKPHIREFMKLIYSKEGQEIVAKDGYVPLTGELAKKELESLNN